MYDKTKQNKKNKEEIKYSNISSDNTNSIYKNQKKKTLMYISIYLYIYIYIYVYIYIDIYIDI